MAAVPASSAIPVLLAMLLLTSGVSQAAGITWTTGWNGASATAGSGLGANAGSPDCVVGTAQQAVDLSSIPVACTTSSSLESSGVLASASYGLDFDASHITVSGVTDVHSPPCESGGGVLNPCIASAVAGISAFFFIEDPLGLDLALNAQWQFLRSSGSGSANVNVSIVRVNSSSVFLFDEPINFSASAGNETRHFHLTQGNWRINIGTSTTTPSETLVPWSANSQMVATMQVVPIPAAAWLLGGALGALAVLKRRSTGLSA